MSSRIGVVPRHFVVTSVAILFAMCLLGSVATAQVASYQPKDEVFGGYSWIHPNGYVDYGYKLHDISKGFDVSNVWYLPAAHNWGLMLDSSAHFNGGQDTDLAYIFGGLQYKYHTDSISPFARVGFGTAKISPPTYVDEWKPALMGGGGIDWAINQKWSIRLAQIDYIYTNYDALLPTHGTQFNTIRLAAGIVFNIGNYYMPTPTAACTATPGEVMEGEPVTVTATGTNFNPKHTLTYAWTANGGKLDTANAQSAKIETTGVAAGSYTANATISDAKVKKGGSATCSATYMVKAKPMNPPQVSCSVNPATVQAGTPSTITATASSPDNSNITGYSYTASAGTISGTGTSATLDTAGTPSGPITVTATATDARNLSGSGTCTVNVENPPPPPMASKIEEIQFPDKKRPWRVDNTAKAILDDVANRLKSDPNAKVVIVGYADGEKAPMEGKGKGRHPMDLAAQRAVNAKAYLVQQQGIDPSRVGVRSGTGQQMKADIIWVPQGANEQTDTVLQGTTMVDETKVMPSENAYPKPHNAAPMPHHHKAAAKKKEAAPAQ